MPYYAFLDEQNFVTEVIAGVSEHDRIDGKTPEEWYADFRGQRCVRTSYNGTIRKNYAGIGFFYDEARDAFIPPQPLGDWVLDEESCQWVPVEE